MPARPLTAFEKRVVAALRRRGPSRERDLVSEVYPGTRWWGGRDASHKLAVIVGALHGLISKGVVRHELSRFGHLTWRLRQDT